MRFGKDQSYLGLNEIASKGKDEREGGREACGEESVGGDWEDIGHHLGGFIKDPKTTVKWVGPKVEAGLEQPFIAYLEGKPVGTVCPLVDRKSASGRLDGGVHVLPEYRRQRIGTTLLITALKWLRNNGMKDAWPQVESTNL